MPVQPELVGDNSAHSKEFGTMPNCMWLHGQASYRRPLMRKLIYAYPYPILNYAKIITLERGKSRFTPFSSNSGGGGI